MFHKFVLMLTVCACLGLCSLQDAQVQREVARLAAPEKLVPKGKQALFMARGEGVQIYVGSRGR
jgi:hypothetical protein